MVSSVSASRSLDVGEQPPRGSDPRSRRHGSSSAEEPAPPFVELRQESLQRFGGGYRDREDQTVLRVAHEDGHLVVTGAPLPLRLAPLSETRFRTVGAPERIELEFGARDVDLQLFENGSLERTFDAIALWEPSGNELRSYVGRYLSDELDSTYTLAVDEAGLILRRGRLEAVPLEPTTRNEFEADGLRLVFDAPQGGRSPGLTAHAGRVRNIRLERVGD